MAVYQRKEDGTLELVMDDVIPEIKALDLSSLAPCEAATLKQEVVNKLQTEGEHNVS